MNGISDSSTEVERHKSITKGWNKNIYWYMCK